MPELAAVDFKSSKLINEVAEVYERYGPGTAKTFLLNKKARESPALVKVIEKLDRCPEVRANRAIGRQILKCLPELRKEKKR